MGSRDATPPSRHVHANVPIVSAADVRLWESPVADGACEPPFGRLPKVVRGRDQLIAGLRADTGRVVVLTGAAGCGKTTVALAAADRLRDERRVFWVAGQHRAALVEGLAAVARELGAADVEIARAREEASPALVWRLVTAHSTNPARAVLVIDDVDEPELASDVVRQARALLPAHWLIIVTTRVRPDRPASTLEVGRLPVEDGAELLLDRIPEMDRARRRRELPHARTAAELLGRVPLALHVAGSYLGSSLVRHTVAGFVTELSRAPGPHPASFLLPAVTLVLASFDDEERECARHLMRLLAAGAAGQPFPVGPLLAAGEPVTERGLRLLGETGLADVVASDELPVVVLPPLVARAAVHADGMRLAGLLDAVTGALESGAATYVEPGGDPWPLWRLLLPHVAHVLAGAASAEAFRAAHRTIHHLMHRGMYRSAADLAAVAADHADDTMRRTAMLDRGLARQARARVTRGNDLERAFQDINEVALWARRAGGPDDPEALETEHRLAAILHERGHLAESEHLFGQVLEARRRVLGEDHAGTLDTMHRLAAVLQAAGRAAEAGEMLDAVLAHLGDTHPDALAVRHSLAYARQAAGGPDWLRDAERDFGAVLADRRRLLGPTHPDTLITRHNVAWLEQAKGHYVSAEDGFRGVLAVQLKRLGGVHPHTVAVAANLAWVLLLRRRFPAARRIFAQVLKVRTTRLGVSHPHSQITRGNLGWLTYEEGDFPRAEHRFRRLYADRVRLLGPDHPLTLTTRHNLALSLRSQRELIRARDELVAVRDAQQRVLAESHDSTLATAYDLAVTLRMLGSPARLEEAMTLLDEVLDTLRGRQDPHNPLLRQTKREIVTLLAVQSGRPDAGELVDDGGTGGAEPPSTSVDDPLIEDFVDDDIDDFRDPDLVDYTGPAR